MSGTFWTAFLRSLKARGLGGVRLVISDAHEGLKKTINKCFQGASWQRCKVHLVRNLLAKVQRSEADVIAAAFRSIFVGADPGEAIKRWDEISDMLAAK